MPGEIDEMAELEWKGMNWGAVLYENRNFTFDQRNLYISECCFWVVFYPPIELFLNIRNHYPQTIFVIEAEREDHWYKEVQIMWISKNEDMQAFKDYVQEYENIRKRFKARMADFFETIDD